MKRFRDHKQHRFPYFNYASSGLYFITICTKNRVPFFGKIENGEMKLSQIGVIVHECWNLIPTISPFAQIDCYAIMPDHFHGIICVNNPDEKTYLVKNEFKIRGKSVSTVISGFKAAVTKRCNEIDPYLIIWQSRFYDRIVRNEQELQTIRNYILNNPLKR